MSKAEVEEVNGADVAYDWKDANSYDRPANFVSGGAVDAMLNKGLTKEDAEWVFRSKHMRWFYDQHSDEIQEFMKDLFAKYLKRNENGVMDDVEKVRNGEQP